MPELPEVQAHCERLSEQFGGRSLRKFQPLSFSVLKTFSPGPKEAEGRTLTRVHRRGKFLLLEFGEAGVGDAGAGDSTAADRLTFVVHLMQAGRLVPDAKQSAKPRNGMARWVFHGGGGDGGSNGGDDGAGDRADDGGADVRGDVSALLLTEAGKERKAGVWLVAGDPLKADPLLELGVEADQVTFEQLKSTLAKKNQRVHGFLRDQRGISGIGRLLANEICFRAKLSPFAMTGKLTDGEIERLLSSIHSCIADALEYERSLDAMSKSADRPAAVHHRSGDLCPDCGDVVRSVNYNAYEVNYCASCQTGGKVLADNTTSKFLK